MDVDDFDDKQTSDFTSTVRQTDPPTTPTRIKRFFRYFEELGKPCPTFFPGTFSEACHAALETANGDRRPLLVYVHHQQASFTNTFCSEIFFPSVVDYLLEKYIVWPCDISSREDLRELLSMWSDLYICINSHVYRTKDLSMLIGVRRAALDEKTRFSPPDYRYEVLVEGLRLTKTDEVVTGESVLSELKNFKEKFDQTEIELTFSIQESCGLCWDVIVEISKYLTLNAAVKVFSPDFIREIKKERFPVHISNECELFMPLLAASFGSNRLRTLHLNVHESKINSICYGPRFNGFCHSLHLRNFQREGEIRSICERFGPVQHLSLWFNNKLLINDFFRDGLCCTSPTVDVEIHSPGVMCYHTESGRIKDGLFICYSSLVMKSLLFDFGCSPSPSASECFEHRETCCLDWITRRITYIKGLQTIRFRLSSLHVKILFFADLWKSTLEECLSLDRVIIRLIDNPPDDAMLRKAATVEADLQSIRPNFRFRLKS